MIPIFCLRPPPRNFITCFFRASRPFRYIIYYRVRFFGNNLFSTKFIYLFILVFSSVSVSVKCGPIMSWDVARPVENSPTFDRSSIPYLTPRLQVRFFASPRRSHPIFSFWETDFKVHVAVSTSILTNTNVFFRELSTARHSASASLGHMPNVVVYVYWFLNDPRFCLHKSADYIYVSSRDVEQRCAFVASVNKCVKSVKFNQKYLKTSSLLKKYRRSKCVQTICVTKNIKLGTLRV